MTTFKVGDKVSVVGEVHERSLDFQNMWVTSMSRAVNDGKTYTIKTIRLSGIYFKERNCGWPPASLELTENYVDNPKERVSQKIRTLWKESNYVKNHPKLVY